MGIKGIDWNEKAGKIRTLANGEKAEKLKDGIAEGVGFVIASNGAKKATQLASRLIVKVATKL